MVQQRKSDLQQKRTDENANPNLMAEELPNPEQKTYYEERFNDAIARTVDGIMESLDFDDVVRHYDLESIDNGNRMVCQKMFSMLRDGLREQLILNFSEIAKKFDSQEFFAKKFEFEEKKKIGGLMDS